MRRHSLALAGAGLAVVALRCSTSTAQPTAPTTTWAEPSLTRYSALRMAAYDHPPLGGKARRDAAHGTRKKVPRDCTTTRRHRQIACDVSITAGLCTSVGQGI